MKRPMGVVVMTSWLVACGRPSDEASLEPMWAEPLTGMEFVLVEAGGFEMGLRHGPPDVRPAPAHHVTLTQPFYLGRFEVTQGQWTILMGENPSQFADCGESCPVESVSWLDVQEFLDELNSRSRENRFRLPTEAEWEFACRSGLESRYTDGLEVLTPELANYNPEIPFEGLSSPGFREQPTPVGSFPGNALGLHDVHGNVWEWTQDQYCPYAAGAVVDPVGQCGSDTISIRGGSWLFSANAARCGRRFTHARTDSGFSLGFRVVREVVPLRGTA